MRRVNRQGRGFVSAGKGGGERVSNGYLFVQVVVMAKVVMWIGLMFGDHSTGMKCVLWRRKQ